jgi:hypothetical protein
MGRGWRAGLGRDRAVCQKAVIDDPDIFHAAKLLIDQHGADAAVRAAVRADVLLADGDPEGSEVWHRILEAIEELTRGRREGEAVN